MDLIEKLAAKQEALAKEREQVILLIDNAKETLRTIDAKLKRIPQLMVSLESLDLDGLLDDENGHKDKESSRRGYRGHHRRKENQGEPVERVKRTYRRRKTEGTDPEASVQEEKRQGKKKDFEGDAALVIALAEEVKSLTQEDAVMHIAGKFDGIIDVNLAAQVFLEAGLMRRLDRPSLTKCKRAVASVTSRKVRDGIMVRVDDTTVAVTPHKDMRPSKPRRPRGSQRSKPFHTSIEGR